MVTPFKLEKMRTTITIILLTLCSSLSAQLRFTYESLENLGKWRNPIGDYGDLDNDGDLDLIITGYDQLDMPKAKLFENVNGQFIQKTIGFIQVSSGDVVMDDLNNDGQLDILITGTTYTERTPPDIDLYKAIGTELNTQVFLNQGNWVFSEVSFEFDGFFFNSINVVDFDNNDLTDIFISGITHNGIENVFSSIIYKNLGNSNFEKINIDLPEIARVKSDWYDYDNDGFPDLVISGRKPDRTNYAKLLKNMGNFDTSSADGKLIMFEENTFSLKAIGYHQAVLEWVDLNDDGLKDILQSGDRDVVFYANRGNGNFELVNDQIRYSSVSSTFAHFGDINNDQKIDLYMKRFANNPAHGIIQTDGNFGFNETRIDLLDTTNVTSPFGLLTDFNKDGKDDILVLGHTQGSDSHLYISDGGVRVNDSHEFEIQFNISKNFDVDSDGDIDIIASPNQIPNGDQDQSSFYLFDNKGNKSFEGSPLTGLPTLKNINFDIEDFNKDGLADIFITGISETNQIRSGLYLNKGNGSFSTHSDNFGFEPLYSGSVKMFDFDHDGDLDIFYSGAARSTLVSSGANEPNNLKFKIYKNVIDSIGFDSPFISISNEIEPTIFGDLDFIDLDKNGYEELVILGNSNVTDDNQGSAIMHVYALNESKDDYVLKSSLNGLRSGSFGHGDLNLNGLTDIVISGRNESEVVFSWLRNVDGESFEEIPIQAGEVVEPLFESSINIVDFDFNGRPDIVLTGRIDQTSTTFIITNFESDNVNYPLFGRHFQNVRLDDSNIFGQSSIADFDNDGDSDFLISSQSTNIRLFENLEIVNEEYQETLEAPIDFNAKVSNWNVELDWTNPNSEELNYLIFIDDGSEEDLTFENLRDEKFRRLKSGSLNKTPNSFFEFRGLKDKIYNVKIIGVNNKLQTTPFSRELQFEIKQPYPIDDLSGIAVSDTQIVLSWTDKSFSESGYELERSPSQSFQNSTTISLTPDSEEFEDNMLEPNTSYFYRLRTKRDDLSSRFSQIIEVKTLDMVTSLEDNLISKSISIFPNPSHNGSFYINAPTTAIKSVLIYDSSGRVVQSRFIRSIISKASKDNIEFTIEGFGLFSVLIRTESNGLVLKKLLVK